MTALSPQALAWIRSQIVPTKPFIYLNSGYTGPSPRRAGAAARAWMMASYEKGFTTPQAVEEQHRVTENPSCWFGYRLSHGAGCLLPPTFLRSFDIGKTARLFLVCVNYPFG